MPKLKSMRVVSFSPAATEMLFALGAGDCLLGRSHACDHPREALEIPPLTRLNIDASGSSADVQAAVGRAQARGLPLFTIDSELLRALRPTLILAQNQCSVCGPGPGEIDAAGDGWSGKPPRVLTFAPGRFVDLWTDLRGLADALGLADHGRSAVQPFKARVAAVAVAIAGADHLRRPTVACLDWIDPPMLAGHWMPDLIELAGGRPIAAPAGTPSVWTSLEQVAASGPDVVWAAPCGLNLARADAAWRAAAGLWTRCRRKRALVYAADGSAGFNRPGPSLVDSLEAMAEALHPKLYPEPRRMGTWWRAMGVP